MNLQNLRLASKLWLSVAVIVLGIALVVGYAAIQSRSDRVQSTAALDKVDAQVKLALKWASLVQSTLIRAQSSVMLADPAFRRSLLVDMSNNQEEIAAITKGVADSEMDGTLREKFNLLMQQQGSTWFTTQEFLRKAAQAAAPAPTESAAGSAAAAAPSPTPANWLNDFNSQVAPGMAKYQKSLQEFVELQEAAYGKTRSEYEDRAQSLILVASAIMLLLVLGIVAGTAWLIHSIRQPLVAANALASRIAQGDLSGTVEVTRSDEFGELMVSLSSMSTSLARMVNQVRQSTNNIATASAEIAQGNNDLAQRTEQASGNLQSTASSTSHLTETVQGSANNARQASALAANASSVAERGGAVVRQVVTTMEDINTSSRKIADIIGVIDSIAFQTNILALNAAVEAARAGDQGRGFAVVASEVRSLAQRSAEAAKEIKMLINSSVEKVASGTQLVSDAGTTMDDIVNSVRKVADVIGEITTAANEQSAEIADINQSIGNLDQMTQQNAALVEQSAAAAESLREQADHLALAVAAFKTDSQSLQLHQRPTRDITPSAQSLGYRRPGALSSSRPPTLARTGNPRQLGASPPRVTARAAAPKSNGMSSMSTTQPSFSKLGLGQTSGAKEQSPSKTTAPKSKPQVEEDWETF